MTTSEQREPDIIAVARSHVARCSHTTPERVIDGSCVFKQDNGTYYRVGGLLAAYDDCRAQLAAAEVRVREEIYRGDEWLREREEARAQLAAAEARSRAYAEDIKRLDTMCDEERTRAERAERVVQAADYFCSYQGTAKEAEYYEALCKALDATTRRNQDGSVSAEGGRDGQGAG